MQEGKYKKSARINKRHKRSWFFGLQNQEDVDKSISSAISLVELERADDEHQRKKLADSIKANGLKLEHEWTSIKNLNLDLCSMASQLELEIEKLKIRQLIDEKISKILHILEHCKSDEIPILLQNERIQSLCKTFASEENCNKISHVLDKLSSCQVLGKYLTEDLIVIDLLISLPVVSSSLSVGRVHTLPFFRQNETYQLQLEENFILYDSTNMILTNDCFEVGSLILCQEEEFASRNYQCIHGLMTNQSISSCNFEHFDWSSDCYFKQIKHHGVLISNNEQISLYRRLSGDHLTPKTIRQTENLKPGVTFIPNQQDIVTAGNCANLHFETGDLKFLSYVSIYFSLKQN